MLLYINREVKHNKSKSRTLQDDYENDDFDTTYNGFNVFL